MVRNFCTVNLLSYVTGPHYQCTVGVCEVCLYVGFWRAEQAWGRVTVIQAPHSSTYVRNPRCQTSSEDSFFTICVNPQFCLLIFHHHIMCYRLSVKTSTLTIILSSRRTQDEPLPDKLGAQSYLIWDDAILCLYIQLQWEPESVVLYIYCAVAMIPSFSWDKYVVITWKPCFNTGPRA
jgi:hypothetical protein